MGPLHSQQSSGHSEARRPEGLPGRRSLAAQTPGPRMVRPALGAACLLLLVMVVLAGLPSPAWPDVPYMTEFRVGTEQGTEPAVYGDTVVWVDQRHGNSDIYRYDLASGTESAVSTDPSEDVLPSIWGDIVVWQANGNHEGGGSDIYAYNLARHEKSPICESGSATVPAVSGRYVVWVDSRYSTPEVPNPDIYAYDLTTGQERVVCDDPSPQGSVSISGDTVVWQDARHGPNNYDIYGYDLATNTEFPICTDPGSQYDPAISGDTVVWQDFNGGNYPIRVCSLTDKLPRTIHAVTGGRVSPRVSAGFVVWAQPNQETGLRDVMGYDLASLAEFVIRDSAGPDPDPGFQGGTAVWADGRTGAAGLWGARMGRSSFTVTPSVAGAPDGHGSISPADPQSVDVNGTPTFTFSPDPGYHVAGVTVDGVAVAMTGIDQYTFPAITADHTISVAFAADAPGTFTVTPSVTGGHGSVSPAAPQTVEASATPTFTFTPDAGYQLGEVRVDGVVVALTGTTQYTFPPVTADHTINVTFAPVSPTPTPTPTPTTPTPTPTPTPTVTPGVLKATAPSPATVKRGRSVALVYRIDGSTPGNTADVAITIKTMAGKVVSRKSAKNVPLNTAQTFRFTCVLNRGRYRFFISAVSADGGATTRSASNILTVK